MKVKEIMERANLKQTGRALAFIKDALDEINIISETHVDTVRMDITQDKRFYPIPNDCLQVLDIRCKHYNNDRL